MLLRLLPHFCLHSPTLQVYFVTDGHPINNFEFFRPSIKTSMESEMESLNVLKCPCTRPCMTMRLAPPLP